MRVPITELRARKQRQEKFAVLTAYDAAMARLFERASIDVLLVGDSVGMTLLGYDSTIPVTLDMMVHHTAAVVRGTERALVIADMPFLAAQTDTDSAVQNAGRLIQQAGAAAVKIEGGRAVMSTVRRLVEVGIPVMGHLGLLPQSVNQLGGYGRQAKTPEDAETLLAEAVALQQAGAFAIVLECIPPALAARVTSRLDIPTIGIGAGPDCDGQVLVSHDILGLTERGVPSFVRTYANLADSIVQAAHAYADDVRQKQFPARAAAEPASR
jgi:3-methyl-2-oxobutanoate hydroxymethyltransferase